MDSLDICRSLFQSLKSSNVRYCHWKSNSHLEKALMGRTDLDILIAEQDKLKFKENINKLHFKKILSPPQKQFPDLEDYLGFDDKTGTLIHLHVHYKLILGEQYIKNHHLPLEEWMLDNLMINDYVHIPLPEIELILLVIRSNFKIESLELIKTFIKNIFGQIYIPYPKNIEIEFDELIRESKKEKIGELLKSSQLPLVEELIYDFLEKFRKRELNFTDILKIKKEIRQGLKKYQRDKSFGAKGRYFFLKALNTFYSLNLLHSPNKTLPGKGKIISIVGADGSGKSTLSKEITEWLSWKLETDKLYYGIPKNAYVRFVDLAVRGANKFRLYSLARLLDSYMWLHVAMVRYKVYKKSSKLAEKGNVVIIDRFPLVQFRKMEVPMDGPRLDPAKGFWYKLFSEKELACYDRIKLPDCIIVLQASVTELRKRKSDLDITSHSMKADAVNNLKQSPVLSLVDANNSYSEVELAIKKVIWDII